MAEENVPIKLFHGDFNHTFDNFKISQNALNSRTLTFIFANNYNGTLSDSCSAYSMSSFRIVNNR